MRGYPIALVFTPPPSSWPASVFPDVSAAMAGSLLEALASLHEVVVTAETRDFVLGAAARGYLCSLEVVATTPNGLGLALNAFLDAGAVPYATYDETIEVVFRCPIPASAIERMVPLYRTNTKFRARSRTPWPDRRS